MRESRRGRRRSRWNTGVRWVHDNEGSVVRSRLVAQDVATCLQPHRHWPRSCDAERPWTKTMLVDSNEAFLHTIRRHVFLKFCEEESTSQSVKEGGLTRALKETCTRPSSGTLRNHGEKHSLRTTGIGRTSLARMHMGARRQQCLLQSYTVMTNFPLTNGEMKHENDKRAHEYPTRPQIVFELSFCRPE